MRKLIHSILPLLLLLHGLPVLAETQSKATSPLDIRDPVEEAIAAKLMTNLSDGKFHPEGFVSRAELATILVKTFDLDKRKPIRPNATAPQDVPSSYWAYKDIQTVLKTDVMTGYEADRFFPNQRITRAEAFAIFANGYSVFDFPKQTIDEILAKYPDAKDIPKWARKAMATALSEDFVNLDEKGNINPLKPMTRGDMAYAVSKYLEKDRGRYPTTPLNRGNKKP